MKALNRYLSPTQAGYLLTGSKVVFAAIVLAQIVKLLIVAGKRVAIPLDLLIWSESPFMTNMMKLHSGIPIFTDSPPITEANSFVYSPGNELFTYMVLRPFGLHLQVVWCRAVSIGLAVAGGMLASLWSISAIYHRNTEKKPGLVAIACATSLFILMKFSNPTAYVIHPDNISTATLLLTGFLCWLAIQRGSLTAGIAALAVAALIPWAKQNALFAPGGALLCVLIGYNWNRNQRIALWVAGLGLPTLALLALFGSPNNWFWLLEVPLHHPMEYEKARMLVMDHIFGAPLRFLLLVTLPVVLIVLLRRKEDADKSFMLSWGFIGVLGCAPMLSGYFKEMGLENNLGIIDIWMTIPILYVVLPLFDASRASDIGEDSSSWGLARRGLSHVYFWAFLLVLAPASIIGHKGLFRMPASDPALEYKAYYDTLKDRVGRDLEAGRSVLIAHGSALLIENGVTAPPLDRANSCLEVAVASVKPLGTIQRFREQYYDRIYMPVGLPIWKGWYGLDAHIMLNVHYIRVDFIEGLSEKVTPPMKGMDLFSSIEVLEPRDTPLLTP